MFTDHPGPAPDSASWRRDLLLLTLAFGALYFALLGGNALSNPDESRYSEIPREMLATGDFVTPKLNGVNYFEKPPLLYWAVAACFAVFGQNEWAARIMPALSGLFGVLLTYAAARRLHGRAAGVASAIVLGSSLLFFALSRLLILDMAVSMLMCATLFCFILGVREAPGARRRWLFYGLYASAALATLTKGLIGFLVTGAVMFLWLLVFNQWKRLRPLHLPSGIALFLAIALPWHLLAAQRNPTWAEFYLIHEHFTRFTTTVHGRYEPWWYFIPIVALGIFPWTGFFWNATREALADAVEDADAYAESLVARAHELRLSESKEWLRLGHYRRKALGLRSDADGPDFFLAADGKRDPAAELDASLRGFFRPPTFTTGKVPSHPLCRFPARLAWLVTKLSIDRSRLRMPRCEKFEEYW
jgi:4-amino-4-deoxy-L-arabinose transferase-like glycosyltransferase